MTERGRLQNKLEELRDDLASAQEELAGLQREKEEVEKKIDEAGGDSLEKQQWMILLDEDVESNIGRLELEIGNMETEIDRVEEELEEIEDEEDLESMEIQGYDQNALLKALGAEFKEEQRIKIEEEEFKLDETDEKLSISIEKGIYEVRGEKFKIGKYVRSF